ncbi:hypothetical protein [Marinilabilia salmonicolor]|uniref:hypothetical protein n=1 Tax=Marinilabilia salmonicolor TaxID=989 RepID=UPI00029B0EFD|nr:hypothetical protein [Marinilabilia salmonicolor]
MDRLQQLFDRYDGDILVRITGYDKAIIGVCDHSQKVIYSLHKIISILKEKDGMTLEEAMEWYEYNISDVNFGQLIIADDLYLMN